MTILNGKKCNLFYLTNVELGRSEVIQEKQRLSTMRKNVVDTHGHKVNANRRVVPDGLGHLELGPHT
jgi:hypothetical protein